MVEQYSCTLQLEQRNLEGSAHTTQGPLSGMALMARVLADDALDGVSIAALLPALDRETAELCLL